MNLSELPQSIIDRFFEFQHLPHDIKSRWTKKYYLIQSSNIPYFRIIFKDDKYIYKIFYDKTIINAFNTAIERNFFNNIAIIKNFITYNNQKIGYVTQVFDMAQGIKMKRTVKMISKLEDQSPEFINLYDRICQNIVKTNIAYMDIYPTNIVKYQKKFYIIDLDSVIDLNKTKMSTIDNGYGSLPPYYIEFIKRYIKLK